MLCSSLVERHCLHLKVLVFIGKIISLHTLSIIVDSHPIVLQCEDEQRLFLFLS